MSRAVDVVPATPHLRWSALLHDIGKVYTREVVDGRLRYPKHAEVGAEKAEQIARRLGFPNHLRTTVATLVHHHGLDEESQPHVLRRLQYLIGPDRLRDLVSLHQANVAGTGAVPSESKTRLRDVLDDLEKEGLFRLAISGHDVIEHLQIRPSPLVGEILRTLTERALDDPRMNTRERLLSMLDEWR